MQSFDSIMKFIFVATGVSSTWSWLRLNSSRFLFVFVTDYFFDALELGIDERARSISAKCCLAPGDGKTYGSLISFHSPTITWLSVMLPISFLLAGENQCYCYRRHDNTVIANMYLYVVRCAVNGLDRWFSFPIFVCLRWNERYREYGCSSYFHFVVYRRLRRCFIALFTFGTC